MMNGMKLAVVAVVGLGEMLLFFPFSLFGFLPVSHFVGDLMGLDMRD